VKSYDSATKTTAVRTTRGFTLLETLVVCGIAMTVMAIAILQVVPASSASHADDATREVIEQIRQAREYSIENRRYVQIQFSSDSAGRPDIVTTQKNSLTANAGADLVISTMDYEGPVQYCVCTMPDTPDAYGNGSATYFYDSASGAQATALYFQSDGELVDAANYMPVNGTVFLAIGSNKTWARAITILGTTGRVRAYKTTGTAWVSF
jgi:type II secretory pathway pseudopilin PulG